MSSDPWRVPVLALRRAPGSVRHERRVGPLGELRVADTVVPEGADVAVDADLRSVDGGVEVVGEVDAPWAATCRRCLRPVEGRLSAPVRELYRPHAGSGGGDEEDDTYDLGVDHLDLAPLARDAVLLALPLAPLCREDCPGLCPTCGAELAAGPCGCAAVADPRWGALDVLRGSGSAGDPSTA